MPNYAVEVAEESSCGCSGHWEYRGIYYGPTPERVVEQVRKELEEWEGRSPRWKSNPAYEHNFSLGELEMHDGEIIVIQNYQL